MKSINCLIVDDDEIDRLTVLANLRHYPFVQVRGVYASAGEAVAHLSKELVQILFLDVEMPEMSGIDLRMKFLDVPVCIFITSYPDFALEGFEAAAFDYIVKPFTADRFAMAMQRAKDYLEVKEKADLFEYSLGHDTVFIKEGHEKTKIKLHDIVYLEALKDYTSIVTAQKKYCVLASLGNLLLEDNFQSFIRIHRSYAVQKHFIHKVDTRNVYLDKTVLPLGRTFKKDVDELLQ
jgi:two-component system, LytTR family, response regulator